MCVEGAEALKMYRKDEKTKSSYIFLDEKINIQAI